MKIEIEGMKLRAEEVFLHIAGQGGEVKLYDDDGSIIGWRDDGAVTEYNSNN